MVNGSRNKYGVILADVPWSYQNWTDARNGAARSAMVCQDEEFLKEIPVDKWAARDSILAFWATMPKLNFAHEIAAAWGFEEYVTAVPWVKTTPSTGNIKTITGFWTRCCAELLMIFRRNEPKAHRKGLTTPAGLLEGNGPVFWSPPEKRQHSSKPLGIHKWLSSQLNGPYLEIFARNSKPGWVCWGYDLGQELGPWGVREHEEIEGEIPVVLEPINVQTTMF